MRVRRWQPFKTEADLAERVVAWLEDQGFEVFQEVQPRRYDRRADLVGRRGSTIVAIETKLSFGERVIDQARRWMCDANMVWVAVPYVDSDHPILRLACKYLGVGVLEVSSDPYHVPYGNVRESVAPAVRRRVGTAISGVLCDGHKKTLAAGSQSGGHWTPFRETCLKLTQYVATHPGCTLKSAIGSIKHHYKAPSTARGAIKKWIELGKVPGVRVTKEDGKLLLYPVTAEKAA